MLKDECEYFFVNIINEMIEEALPATLSNYPLGTCLSLGT